MRLHWLEGSIRGCVLVFLPAPKENKPLIHRSEPKTPAHHSNQLAIDRISVEGYK